MEDVNEQPLEQLHLTEGCAWFVASCRCWQPLPRAEALAASRPAGPVRCCVVVTGLPDLAWCLLSGGTSALMWATAKVWDASAWHHRSPSIATRSPQGRQELKLGQGDPSGLHLACGSWNRWRWRIRHLSTSKEEAGGDEELQHNQWPWPDAPLVRHHAKEET